MVISSYHINNVLRVYGRQLKNGKRKAIKLKNESNSAPDTIKISLEGKKKYLSEKMVSELMHHISKGKNDENIEKKVLKEIENELGTPIKIKKDSNGLTFKLIDKNGETIKTLTRDQINLTEKTENTESGSILDNPL